MKKIFLSFGVFSLFIFASCGGAKKEDVNANVPKGMVAADLSAVSEGRMPVLMNVPDSTVGPLQVSANSQGGADVKVGKSFQMAVMEGAGDMETKKKDVTHDDVRKFVKYVMEDANAIIWEWQIEGMEPEFHFYAVVKAGAKSFEVRDVEGEVFSEKSAVQMLDAAKTIRMKEVKAAS
ncbi:MAG: hypothetical protein HY063_01555 [Bacteroidetes bacterium]|nr:hypothetical protein [Bacteroidota bacterium]